MATFNSLEFTGSYSSFNGNLFSTKNTSSAGFLFYSGSDMYFTSQNSSAWSISGATKAQRRTYGGGVGDQSAFFEFGGEVPNVGHSNTSCIYNGSSWANGPNMSTTGRSQMGSFGTVNGAVAAGGGLQPNGAISTNVTEEYNGSSWSSGGNMIASTYGNGLRDVGSAGQSGAAGLVFGGKNYPTNATCPLKCTEAYDGTSWSTQSPLIVQAQRTKGFGTQNDAVRVAGWTYGYPGICQSEQDWKVEGYDGTSWSNLPNHPIGGARLEAMGINSNSGQTIGGTPNCYITCNTGWNGSSWYSRSTLPCDVLGNNRGGNNALVGEGIYTYSCQLLEESTDVNIQIKKLS